MTFGLTKKQSDLLAFLRERQAAGGAMPSYAEMCVAIGTTSKGNVACILDALIERGAIRRLPNRARSIEVILKEPPTLDDETAIVLRDYCAATGYARQSVIAHAVREYVLNHPVDPAGGQR